MTFIDQGCGSIFPLFSTEGGKSLSLPDTGASHVLDESLMIFFLLPWPNRWNYLFKRNVVKYIHL